MLTPLKLQGKEEKKRKMHGVQKKAESLKEGTDGEESRTEAFGL